VVVVCGGDVEFCLERVAAEQLGFEEGVGGSLVADGGELAVAGDDEGVVGEGEEMGVDGAEEGFEVAAGEVGAADGSGEEGVSGEEETVLGEVEADAALGVAGGVVDGGGEAFDADGGAFGEVDVGGEDLGGFHAEPACLDVHHGDEREVVLVVEDGGSGEAFEFLGSGDVVDVGVGDDDLLDGEVVLGEEGEDVGDVVAGIDDDGLEGGFVAEEGAVAADGAYGEGFADHDGLQSSVSTCS
jgi:hypothetical protein